MSMIKKSTKGFTLIELMVVIAIIAILSGIVLGFLTRQNAKANDKKILSQLSSMRSQVVLYSGTTGVPVTPTLSSTITPVAGPAGTSTIFNDSTFLDSSLYTLISQLPQDTRYYYAWNGLNPATTGKWFFVATLSDGAHCVDWNGSAKTVLGTPPTTIAEFTDAAHFPNANAVSYLCN